MRKAVAMSDVVVRIVGCYFDTFFVLYGDSDLGVSSRPSKLGEWQINKKLTY